VTVFSKLVPVRFVAFVERVVETLRRPGCSGCPPVMKIGHFLYSAFTALHGQLPVPEDVVYEGSRLLALCEAGSHASLPTMSTRRRVPGARPELSDPGAASTVRPGACQLAAAGE
jgi:hypothetical protein